MDLALLTELNAERSARRAVAVVTDIRTGLQRLVRAVGVETDPLAEPLRSAFRSGKSGTIAGPDSEMFVTVHVPPTRILVVGAVHISQALAPMARLAGFDVDIVDPRSAFATPERFPGILLAATWPEDVLKLQPLDAYTALVALTHDPKIDDVPLLAALDAGCFYVGALGSRKTHAGRLARLAAAGATEETLARIDAPIGLDIGAANPAEIAVAVLGAVIRALRRPERVGGA
jgi:xanthine dehydrogenase accessory factor